MTVASDACAAPDLEYAGTRVGGADVHAAFMAALADGYAEGRLGRGATRRELDLGALSNTPSGPRRTRS